ncbi:TPA: TetR/AcrR family transcriptional regulator [Streptococcus suis]|nr:TetR/AcrR family transcriptional regulator [Streptococcus suis]HEM3638830.1 TetR/AcrR family transcriptional regulator [Streptococcus suis]
MNKNELATRKTRQEIIDISRKKFKTKGYFNTSLQEIAQEIGLTRGALYHNFSNKKEIFFEIIKEIQAEIGDYVEMKAIEQEDPWQQLIKGCIAFVEKAVNKDIARIMIIDGPSVITWEEWKNLDAENSESHLKTQLAFLRENYIIKNFDIDYLTSYISGGLNEIAMYISYEDNFRIKEVEQIIISMLCGLKNNG